MKHVQRHAQVSHACCRSGGSSIRAETNARGGECWGQPGVHSRLHAAAEHFTSLPVSAPAVATSPPISCSSPSCHARPHSLTLRLLQPLPQKPNLLLVPRRRQRRRRRRLAAEVLQLRLARRQPLRQVGPLPVRLLRPHLQSNRRKERRAGHRACPPTAWRPCLLSPRLRKERTERTRSGRPVVEKGKGVTCPAVWRPCLLRPRLRRRTVRAPRAPRARRLSCAFLSCTLTAGLFPAQNCPQAHLELVLELRVPLLHLPQRVVLELARAVQLVRQRLALLLQPANLGLRRLHTQQRTARQSQSTSSGWRRGNINISTARRRPSPAPPAAAAAPWPAPPVPPARAAPPPASPAPPPARHHQGAHTGMAQHVSGCNCPASTLASSASCAGRQAPQQYRRPSTPSLSPDLLLSPRQAPAACHFQSLLAAPQLAEQPAPVTQRPNMPHSSAHLLTSSTCCQYPD